jgi:hypothetical protein
VAIRRKLSSIVLENGKATVFWLVKFTAVANEEHQPSNPSTMPVRIFENSAGTSFR